MFLSPLPRGIRHKLQTAMFVRRSMIWVRFNPRSVEKHNFHVRISSVTVLISFGSSSTTPRSGQNPSESLCTGLWVHFQVFGIQFNPVLSPNPIRNRRFPAGPFEMFGARAAQPRRASSYPSYVYDWRLEAGGQRKHHFGFSRSDYLRRSMTTFVTAI